jgi:MFS transporter, ACS family, hexuronate transporter
MSRPGPQGLSRGAAWALALAATLTMAVSYFDRQTLAVLAPTVTRALGISDASYGWLISAFSFAYLVGAPLAGRLIDRVGCRRGLLGAVVVWSAVAALHALAPSFAALFALRIALGLAESPSFPGAAQTVQRALPPAERARGFGVLFTGSSFGAMVAPPLAAHLEHRYNFRIAFLCTAVIGLLWLPVWLAVAFSPAARRVLDGTAGGGAEGAAAGDPRADPSGPRLAGRAPTLLEVAKHPAVVRGVVGVVACAPAIGVILNWSAKYLVHEHGLAQKDVGLYLWLPPVLYDAGSLLFGHLASVRGRRLQEAAAGAPGRHGSPARGLFAAAAVLGLAIGAMPLSTGPGMAVALAGLAMAGGGGMFAILTSDMLSRVPPAAVASASGLTAAAQSLAYIVSNPLVGGSIGRTKSYTASLVGLAVWLLPGVAIWLLWTPPPAHDTAEIAEGDGAARA